MAAKLKYLSSSLQQTAKNEKSIKINHSVLVEMRSLDTKTGTGGIVSIK